MISKDFMGTFVIFCSGLFSRESSWFAFAQLYHYLSYKVNYLQHLYLLADFQNLKFYRLPRHRAIKFTNNIDIFLYLKTNMDILEKCK